MSISHAADNLFISQQALSANMKRLEEELGVKLFIRKPVLRLTQAGKMMTFYARQMLRTEAQMASGFADLSANCTGHLAIGMSRQRSNVFFPGIWKRYHKFYENIAISLHGLITSEMIEGVESGKLDMFVGMNVPSTNNLCITPIVLERIVCLINEKVLKKYMPNSWQSFLEKSKNLGIDLFDIKDLPFITFLPDNAIRIAVNQIFAGKNILPKVVMETAEHEIIFNLGCEGCGVAILSPIVLYDYEHGIKKIPKNCHVFQINNDISVNKLSLVYRQDVVFPNYAEGMKKAIIQELTHYNFSIESILH